MTQPAASMQMLLARDITLRLTAKASLNHQKKYMHVCKNMYAFCVEMFLFVAELGCVFRRRLQLHVSVAARWLQRQRRQREGGCICRHNRQAGSDQRLSQGEEGGGKRKKLVILRLVEASQLRFSS